MTIQDLLALDLDKIKFEMLRDTVKELIEDYNDNQDKESFLKAAKKNIEDVYKMVIVKSPEAIPSDNDSEESTPKKAEKKSRKITKDEQKSFDEDLKVCRAKIKAHRDQQNEGKPEKPKPKRHEKIRGHLISIGNLVPDDYKDNLDVLDEIEKLLSETGRSIMKIYLSLIHI